jgi:PAS domain S-box-containing protein
MDRKSKLFSVFVANAIVLVAVITAICGMGAMTIRANLQASQDRILIGHLLDTLSTIKDAETGQRGFLLTGKDEYLAPYNEATERIRDDLNKLTHEANAGRLPVTDLHQLTLLIRHKLNELQETIVLDRVRGLPSALAVVQTDVGENTMDSIRALVERINVRESAELEEGHRRADRFVAYSAIMVVLSAILGLSILYWSYELLKQESQHRLETGLELQRQKDLLEVTLSSIGDAVIVTDKTGRTTFLNHAAEDLTGWKSSEAIGQACSSIFNIVNEETHQAVESPVEKVLRLGNTVGLANHTLLIRKDGTHIPIDDSGSPIKESDGAVRGTVLVFRDFSEHRKVERKLIQARDEAEAANHAKDDFLASLSHELRTPLTPVLAILSSWEHNANLPPELFSNVQMLRRNIELEARTIDDLLDLARVAKGKLSLNPETLDLHDVLHGVINRYRSEIDAKRLSVDLKVGAARHLVRADAFRLEQVFGNILNNAIKFTPSGGKLTLSTSNSTGSRRVAVTFSDNGIGMTKETIEKMFVPFERGEGDVVRRADGLGLGMAIAKSLVDAHGGTMSASSPGIGQGSSFVVSLPTADVERLRVETPSNVVTDDTKLRGFRILFVEDHEDTAEVLSMLLREYGYTVETCATVTEALTLAKEHQFDLLISDVGLPDGTGVDLLHAIRQHASFPAIALTGFGMDSDVARFRKEGFDEHLTKPIDIQELRSTIRDLLLRDGNRN